MIELFEKYMYNIYVVCIIYNGDEYIYFFFIKMLDISLLGNYK